MALTEKRKLGDWGEAQARSFLFEKGYEIVAANFRERFGELDIIAWHDKYHHGRTLCFVEVKTRGKDDGSAQRATQGEKLLRLFKAARTYCVSEAIDMDRTPIQFEQVSIALNRKGEVLVRHDVIPVT